VGFDFLDRVRKTSIVAGLVVSLIVWVYKGPWPALAFITGCAWSLVNIHLLRLLVLQITNDPEKHKLRIAAVLALKVPVLYAIGYVLLKTGRLTAAGLLAGFAWPLAVVVLKAAGRLLLGLDGKRRVLRSPGSGAVRGGL